MSPTAPNAERRAFDESHRAASSGALALTSMGSTSEHSDPRPTLDWNMRDDQCCAYRRDRSAWFTGSAGRVWRDRDRRLAPSPTGSRQRPRCDAFRIGGSTTKRISFRHWLSHRILHCSARCGSTPITRCRRTCRSMASTWCTTIRHRWPPLRPSASRGRRGAYVARSMDRAEPRFLPTGQDRIGSCRNQQGANAMTMLSCATPGMVYNGIDLSTYKYRARERRLPHLHRACKPRQGPRRAIEVARRAGSRS